MQMKIRALNTIYLSVIILSLGMIVYSYNLFKQQKIVVTLEDEKPKNINFLNLFHELKPLDSLELDNYGEYFAIYIISSDVCPICIDEIKEYINLIKQKDLFNVEIDQIVIILSTEFLAAKRLAILSNFNIPSYSLSKFNLTEFSYFNTNFNKLIFYDTKNFLIYYQKALPRILTDENQKIASIKKAINLKISKL